ncbi:uncharacterized protein LOC121369114 [Gigantopelta aegis]|uniref:uncharacterized protein LOC121369114 n=1 Tax=Gigantopelta aegis TaxID=1735272 RepID=UPI001B88AF27|nr:uncharacterized protein LOC121369114 [Gigantopelta aegis]
MMSIFGDCFVTCCVKLHGVPSRIVCLVLLILQSSVINYYLIAYIGNSSFAWIAFDVAIIISFIVSFVIASKKLRVEATTNEHINAIGLGWFAWLVYSTALVARMVIILDRFAHILDEKNFFGPSTLKTTLALASCVFLFLLVALHNTKISSERRRYIEELTGTVIFDIFDTVDIIDVLFDKEARDLFTPGMRPAILAVSGGNIIIPTVPLITLSITNFGRKKMTKRFVSIHKLAVTLLINVPNLVIRMVMWHGFSVGISPFIMKNLLLIGIVLYEFYEHKKEKLEVDEAESTPEPRTMFENSVRDEQKIQTDGCNQNFTMTERI